MNYPYMYPQYVQQVPPMPQVQQPQIQQQPQQMASSGIVWVTSEDTVRNYPIAPGGTVLFMHENEPYMYMKSADQLGRTTFIKKRLVDETDSNDSKIDLKEYIKREEIEELITDKIQKEIEKRISELSFKPTKTRKTVVEEEE